MNFVEIYKHAENIGSTMDLYLKAWHADVAISVEKMRLASCTTVRFSGLGVIENFEPVNERQNVPRAVIRCPVSFDINHLGFDEKAYEEGRLGVLILKENEAEARVSLPELLLNQIIGVSKAVPSYRPGIRPWLKHLLEKDAEPMSSFEPDVVIRLHLEPNQAAKGDEEKLIFDITYLTSGTIN